MSSYLPHPGPPPGIPAPITPDELRAWLDEASVDVPERDRARLLAALQSQHIALRAAGPAQRATMLRARHEAMARAATLPGGRPALRGPAIPRGPRPAPSADGEELSVAGRAAGCLRRMMALWAAGLAVLFGLVAFLLESETAARTVSLASFAIALLLVLAAMTGRGLDRTDHDRGIVATLSMLVLGGIGLALFLGGLSLMTRFVRGLFAGHLGFGDPDFVVPALMLAAGAGLGVVVLARMRRRRRG